MTGWIQKPGPEASEGMESILCELLPQVSYSSSFIMLVHHPTNTSQQHPRFVLPFTSQTIVPLICRLSLSTIASRNSDFVKANYLLNNRATIGVEFRSKTMEIDNKEIKAQIWDTSGQERYRAVTSVYYRGALGALLVYDISRRSSFDNISQWLREVRSQGDNNLVVMLVGNKTDLAHLRAVPTEKGLELAEREGMFFMETSALDATNVDEAFETVIAEIYNHVSKRLPSHDEENGKLNLSGKKLNLPDDGSSRGGMCCSNWG
ncbi:unnamed protein product [Closterium sp. Naga37s-1]|nr:unnamed protein product [Closterium sp. Naga37s-1]